MAKISVTVYPKKYAHGFVVLCFVVVMQSFIMNSHEVFIHIHQGCFAGTGAIVRLPQCLWSKPDGYGKISQCISITKHSKATTVCIFLGIYCIFPEECILIKSVAVSVISLHSIKSLHTLGQVFCSKRIWSRMNQIFMLRFGAIWVEHALSWVEYASLGREWCCISTYAYHNPPLCIESSRDIDGATKHERSPYDITSTAIMMSETKHGCLWTTDNNVLCLKIPVTP